MSADVLPGSVVWVDLGTTAGREQSGRRPGIVISSRDALRAVDTMATLVPCTTRQRPWANHVPLTGDTGLTVPTFAITEQVRTVSRDRIRSVSGHVDDECLRQVMRWVRAWLHAGL